MRKILFVLALPIFIGCAHKSRLPAQVNIDTAQLIPFDEARIDTSTAKSPALYKFENNQKSLWYLASNHSTDASSDTFRFISYVFDTHKVDIAIVEGVESDLGLNPKGLKEQLLADKTSTFYPNGETSFIIELASVKDIPFIGGEPSDKDIYKALIKKGYSAQDFIGFYFVRRIPQEKRSKEVTSLLSLEKSFTAYSRNKAKALGIENFIFSFTEFRTWYKNNQGKDLSLASGDQGEAAPIDGPYFTQKLSKIITTIRDEHILTTIGEMLNTYQNVFIVYGSSHYRVEHRALKKALGMPVEIDLPKFQ